MPIRVLIVDDNQTVRRRVTGLLPEEFAVVASLEDGSDVVAQAQQHVPDVIVLDITLPGHNGLALATQLRAAGSPSRIVFLTVHNDADYIDAAMAAGATGYVVKARMSSDLVPALHAALEGRRFVSATVGAGET